jgi:hypothetical protein
VPAPTVALTSPAAGVCAARRRGCRRRWRALTSAIDPAATTAPSVGRGCAARGGTSRAPVSAYSGSVRAPVTAAVHVEPFTELPRELLVALHLGDQRAERGAGERVVHGHDYSVHLLAQIRASGAGVGEADPRRRLLEERVEHDGALGGPPAVDRRLAGAGPGCDRVRVSSANVVPVSSSFRGAQYGQPDAFTARAPRATRLGGWSSLGHRIRY